MDDSKKRARLIACLLTGLAALGSLPVGAADAPQSETAEWNQWRGPERNGNVEGDLWPTDFSGLDNQWRVELGKGYSGPLVVGDRIFVAESIDKKTEAIRALDRNSGEQLWIASWPGRGKVPFFAAKNGDWIRSTPLHDGEAIYVGGMEEILFKFDAATGGELWRVDFPQRFGTKIPDFGFVSSPLIDGDALFVQAANSIVKLDRQTGETLWRQLAESTDIFSSGAFSSPVLAEIAGTRQLLVQTREVLFGLDSESGEVLWQQLVPHFRGMNILTPVVHQDHVLTSSYRNGTYLYRIEKSGDDFSSREVWKNKVQGYMSSPVIVDGHAYLHLGNGRLACLDLATGKETWISKPFGKYWSLAVQGDRLLALDSGGEVHLLQANPDALKVLDSQQVSDRSTWAHLAIRGDQIFVRDLEGVTAYRWVAPQLEHTADDSDHSRHETATISSLR